MGDIMKVQGLSSHHLFDQPVALRTILGWLKYAENYRLDTRNQMFMEVDTQN
jgi:hypothetical protein